VNIFFSKVLVGLCNTLLSFKIYVIEPQGFMGYPTRGIAYALSIPKYEQCPFDCLDQNNLACDVY
jgi:hypothetical protein